MRCMPCPTLTLATAIALTIGGNVAHAGESDRIAKIEQRLRVLKAELATMRQTIIAHDHEVEAAKQAIAQLHVGQRAVSLQPPVAFPWVPASPASTPDSVVLTETEPTPSGTLSRGLMQIGGVHIQLGGYFEAAGIFRSRNMVTDVTSNWNAIPLPNTAQYHEQEFVESSRGTRVQAVLTAQPDDNTKLTGYFTADFMGGAPTSNYNESNSWAPRLREAWIAYDRTDLGLEILGGQAYSLLTMNRVGVNPQQNNQTIGIDYAYVPGFTYARQAEIRVAKSFNSGQYWLAVSVENPETTYSETAYPSDLGTLNLTNPGIGVDANTLSYSNEVAPDVIVKATADYPRLHLEAYGVGSVFQDRLSQLAHGDNNTVIAGGGGAAALLHVLPKLLDVQVSGLAGEGIGRYGTSQLPDATVGADGKPEALPEFQALAGVIGHPVADVDLYSYLGTEQISARYFNAISKGKITPFGYGNPLYSNAGCAMELSTLTCTANTSGIAELTVGGWWRFLQGNYGTVQVGTQYAYTRKNVFQGAGPTPKADENTVMFSLRWYPFS
jgi:hypothetical protein